MAKIVYNACFGGFGLSDAAIRRYAELKGLILYPEIKRGLTIYWTVPASERPREPKPWKSAPLNVRLAYSDAFAAACMIYSRDIPRTDPDLVRVVEELGAVASDMCADLRVKDVPSGTRYRIDEYDGRETVELADDVGWSIAP